MTTAKSTDLHEHITFPDPERTPDDMTTFEHLAATGSAHHLIQHFRQRDGQLERTLVTGEHFLSPEFRRSIKGLRIPDLLIAFDVDPAAFKRTNAYVISEQGKPPDFVMEVASRSTGRRDVGEKRVYYESVGVTEFWRFDETGRFHGARLGGDRLVDGRYEPVPIQELPDGSLEGYCQVLNLNVRWDHGQLGWYDPSTGRHISTYEDEREARLDEREARLIAESRANSAESRIRLLEAELRRLREASD